MKRREGKETKTRTKLSEKSRKEEKKVSGVREGKGRGEESTGVQGGER